jgi:hypothetical protein
VFESEPDYPPPHALSKIDDKTAKDNNLIFI